MILTKEYMKESFSNMVYAAVREWELEHGLICDFEIDIHGFKARSYAWREAVKRE